MSYYFVVSSLPPLALGAAPQTSYEEVRQMLRMNLGRNDLRRFKLFQVQIDIRNIRALWLGRPLDPRGNLNEKELEEELLVRAIFPPFIGEFLDRYESDELRLRYFSSLFSSFYAELAASREQVIRDLFRLEREIRLCLVALRSRRLKLDLAYELQFEDPQDPFVVQLLLQKEANEASLPEGYEGLIAPFAEYAREPRQLERAVAQFRMRKLEELSELSPFGMDRILGYLARLMLIEDWAKLDYEQGRAALNQLCSR